MTLENKRDVQRAVEKVSCGVVTEEYVAWSRPLALLAFLLLFLLVVCSFSYMRLPQSRAADSPANVFSADRAIAHLRRIAAAPHPIGSASNARVRQYILDQLAQLGYSAQVQDGLALAPDYLTAGMVNNIVVRIPGREPGKAILLVAHYDSVRTGKGAADNGASVASLLETLRALRASGQLAHDLIFLFSDGEEVGMLGARRFVQDRTLLDQVGLVLNFEYRGNSGPVWMFETSGDNQGMVSNWADAVAPPLGNSLLAEIYRRMPNDTDLSIFRQRGIAGLNFAAADRYNSYHTRLDTAEALNAGTVQQQGDMMLAMVRHFDQIKAGLVDKPGDVVYFSVPGLGVLLYPTSLAVATALGACLLFVSFVTVQFRNGSLRIGPTFLAGTTLVLASIGIALLCQLIWGVLCLVHSGYPILLHGSTYNGEWYFAAFLLLSLALIAACDAWAGHRFRRVERTAGTLLYWLVLALVTSIFVPGASYLFVWPLVGVTGGELVRSFLPRSPYTAAADFALRMAGVVPAMLLVLPVVRLTYVALTPAMLAVTITLFTLLLALATPAWTPLRTSRIVGPALAASFLLFALASTQAGFDGDRPEPVNLTHVENGSSGTAFWATTDRQPNAWLSRLLGDKHIAAPVQLFGADTEITRVGRAPLTGIAGPMVRVVRDEIVGQERIVTLAMHSARMAEELRVYVDGVPVLHSSLQGKVFTDTRTADWRMEFYGPPSGGMSLQIAVPPSAAFQVRVIDIETGLPDMPEPMPPAVMAQPFGDSGTSWFISTIQFSSG